MDLDLTGEQKVLISSKNKGPKQSKFADLFVLEQAIYEAKFIRELCTRVGLKFVILKISK